MLIPRRSVTVALGLLIGVLAVAASCSDETGPNQPVEARFTVAPVFGGAASAIDLASIRFVLTRASDGSIARDTVLQIAAGQDSVDLELTVPVLIPGETFFLTLAMVDVAGDTVFRGGPTEVTPAASGGTPPVVPVEVVYVGTGFDAVGVSILPRDTSTFFGEAVILTAVALDSLGLPIPGTPIVWSTPDPAQASVPDAGSGRVIGGSARGTARIVAQLLTGQRDTASVSVQPVPNSIVADQGNNQTGDIGGPLGQALVARVLAADGLGVEGVYVIFAVTGGGGSLLPIDSAKTDSTGRATVMWTLGPTVGLQTVDATTARLPAASAVFSATGLSINATWVNAAGGNWSVGANWDMGVVPGPLDTAFIQLDGTYTVVVDVAASAAALIVGGSSGTQTLQLPPGGPTLTVTGGGAFTPTTVLLIEGGTIDNAGTLSLQGAFGWIDGGLAGTGTTRIETGASLAIGGTVAKSLDAQTLANAGTASWRGTGPVNAGNGAAFINEATGTLGVDATGSFTGGAAASFLNQGSLTRFGTGTTTLGVAFDNDGTADVTGGTLDLTGGGISTGGFTVSAGATLQFGNGTHDLQAGSSVSGAGNVTFGNLGTATIGGSYAITGTTTTLALGVADFSSATTSTTTNLTMGGGTVDGTGILSVTGLLSWTNGVMRGIGTTVVEATGTLNISTTSTVLLIDRTVQNAGTTNWTGTGLVGGAGGTFENLATGTFNAQSTAQWLQNLGGAAPVFINSGAFVRSGAGTSTIAVAFDNGGSVDVQGGTLSLSGGGTASASFTASAPAAVLNFSGGTHVLQALSSVSGTGQIIFGGATATVSGTFTPSVGAIVAAGNVTFTTAFTTGNLTVSGGNLTLGPGTTSVTSFVTSGTGTLTMTNPATVLAVGAGPGANGDVTFGGGSTAGLLTAGTIQLDGDFTQTSTTSTTSFAASGTHITEFLVASIVSFDNASATESRFAFLAITDADVFLTTRAHVLFDAQVTDVGVSGAASLFGIGHLIVDRNLTAIENNGVLFTLDSITVGGVLSESGGVGISVTFARFTGTGQTIPTIPSYQDVDITGTASFAGTDNIPGTLTVSGSGNLTIGAAQTITVGGDFSTTGSATLTMNAAGAVLGVNGDVTFDGGSTNGLLTAGTLSLDGDFFQTSTNSTSSFAASGTHVTEFIGFFNQFMDFENSTATESHFGNLDLLGDDNTISVNTRVHVVGDLLVTEGSNIITVDGPGPLSVDGDIDVVENASFAELFTDTVSVAGALFVSGSFSATLTEFRGVAQTIPTDFYGDVLVSGTAGIGGPGSTSMLDVTVTGDLSLGIFALTVQGNLLTTGSGTLTMDNALSVLNVVGNATFAGGSTAGLLTNGQLTVTGNFTQLATNSSESFAASATHNVTFSSALAQSVSFATPGGTGFSHFADLEILNTAAAVSLATAAQVDGNVTVTSGTLNGANTLTTPGNVTVTGTMSVGTLSLGGALTGTGTYSVATTVLTGNGQVIPTFGFIALSYTNIEVASPSAGVATTFATGISISGNLTVTANGDLDISAIPLTVQGNVTVSGNGSMYLGFSVSLTVAGDLATQDAGHIAMGVGDIIDINGNVTFGGGSTAGLITGGQINIGGNFVQTGASSTTSFAPTGTLVTFDGVTAQSISFANPATSLFNNLRISNSSVGGISLSSDVLVQQLLDTPDNLVTRNVFGNGNTLTTRSIDFDNLALDNVPLVVEFVAGLSGTMTIDNLSFANYAATDIVLTIIRQGGLPFYTFLDFTTLSTPSGGGAWVRIRDDDGPVTNGTFSPQFESARPTTPPAGYIIEENGATHCWASCV